VKRRFARRPDELARIVSFTRELYGEENIDPAMRNVVDLCVEELFVNMITYNTETNEKILIEMQRHGDGVEVRLTDFDVDRFDPRSVAPVNVNAPLEERTPGGLGLYLVLKMANSIHYEYRDRVSKITFIADGK
jgi:serine/threonine-protein kinase RsbW